MRKIDISVLKDNVIDLIGKQWMLITAGNIDHYNMMTASWPAGWQQQQPSRSGCEW